jgi:hypothetical protein
MAPGPLRACVVEQALRDDLPDCVRPVKADSVDLLDLDDSGAAPAAHPQQVLRNLAQPLRASGAIQLLSAGARVI